MNDSDLIKHFENQTLPFDLWNHRMHVRIAYIYCQLFPYPVALERIRLGIKEYNRANNVKESPTTGYNETTTVAFLRIVKSTIDHYEALFPTKDSESFCDTHPHLLGKTLLRAFYSPDRRGHPDAKTRFVEPDICTIPEPRNETGTNRRR